MVKKLNQLTALPRGKGVVVGLHHQDTKVQVRRLIATLVKANEEFAQMKKNLENKEEYLAKIRKEIKERLKNE